MNKSLWLTAFTAGAATATLLDPKSGNRRRARLRDKMDRLQTRFGRTAGKAGRDAANRARGLIHEGRNRFGSDDASDEVLHDRVRSELGHAVANPSAIEVEVEEGVVTLTGPILEDEADATVILVSHVQGVDDVVDRLERHSRAEDISALQGRERRTGLRPDFLQENWSPATRFLFGAGGAALLAVALKRRDTLSMVLGAGGGALLARSVANKSLTDLAGAGEGTATVRVQKTLTVQAPREDVYRLWSNPEKFPRFMSHLDRVESLGRERYRWTAEGPGGATVTWDAHVTKRKENRLIAWRSERDSTVFTEGNVKFEDRDGGTRIHVDMVYSPPAGIAGHALALLFQDDPKSAMDDDFIRMKSLLENGRATESGETVEREDVLQTS